MAPQQTTTLPRDTINQKVFYSPYSAFAIYLQAGKSMAPLCSGRKRKVFFYRLLSTWHPYQLDTRVKLATFMTLTLTNSCQFLIIHDSKLTWKRAYNPMMVSAHAQLLTRLSLHDTTQSREPACFNLL